MGAGSKVCTVSILLVAQFLIQDSQAHCDISGDWVTVGHTTPSRTGTWAAKDYTNVPGVDFNINWNIRHGPLGGNGTYVGSNGLKVEITNANHSNPNQTFYQTGIFSSNCTTINWTVPEGIKLSTAGIWCKAWTIGCESPPPPYGLTMSFLQSLGDNIVLQRAPAKAAVYGLYGLLDTSPKDAKVKVSVTSETTGAMYSVDAVLNTVHQVAGNPEYAACTDCPPAYATWKALLNPTEAGGNYTIAATCTGCGGDPKYWNVSIVNVTFGDVWHCSGQSNMWCVVSNIVMSVHVCMYVCLNINCTKKICEY